MNKCIKKIKQRFLWWRWEEEQENHQWVYKNKECRECSVCGRKELFFGVKYGGTGRHEYEDWRLAK